MEAVCLTAEMVHTHHQVRSYVAAKQFRGRGATFSRLSMSRLCARAFSSSRRKLDHECVSVHLRIMPVVRCAVILPWWRFHTNAAM